ncbi:hypothetical protein ABENE_03345 [Asticcacaulis benevestitus DSM 16100 = ATCC BAA-896]|uniref:Uncharacterized protein n=1 Tax=Asticcacaulis benevestitus DSM 16100 = ATCC BAA-896 TaxID=1121022 RepID=V4Q381_9CAUL|nr:hypothetical protein ABENE_03345 [Asticcacaulis benevestitus DSM 16100 = ATCC BAA-896]
MMKYLTLIISIIPKNQRRIICIIVHIANAFPNLHSIFIEEISQTAWKTTLNISNGNIMATMRHTFSDTGLRHFNTWKCNIIKIDFPARRLQTLDQFKIITAC